MTRNITDPPAANRGARRWLQALVNGNPAGRALLDAAVAERLPTPPGQHRMALAFER